MKQNEIWLVCLDPTIGSEIKKTRPAVIVNDNDLGQLPLKIVVPVTDWKNHYEMAPWMIEITPDNTNGLNKHSAADCFQIRSVSEQRMVRKIGEIDKNTLEKIQKAVQELIGIKDMQ